MIADGKRLPELIEQMISDSPQLSYPSRLAVRKLKAHVKPLVEIGGEIWQTDFQKLWENLCVQDYSASYLIKLKGFLSSVFDWAARKGEASYNPIPLLSDPRELKGKKIAARNKDIKTVTPAEFRLLVATAPQPLATLIAISYYTSLALVDCCYLKWSSVDMERRVIKYCRTKMRRFGRQIEIPMTDSVYEIIDAQKPLRLPEGRYLCEYVFPAAAERHNGSPIHFSRQFSKLAKDLGMPEGTTFHCLRRSAISRWVSNPNADLLTVSSMSGHSQLSSLQLYVKASMDKKRALVATQEEE